MADKDERPRGTLITWLGFSDSPDWTKARPLGTLLGLVVIALMIGGVAAAAAVLFNTIASMFSDSGPSLGAGTLIIGLLGAPFLIWRTIVAQRTVDLAQENHITDMINKAVEGLGAEKTAKKQVQGEDGQPLRQEDGTYISIERTEPNIEVRIGAILALERLAKNNASEVHIQIMEILTAYIRQNAKASDARPLPDCPRYTAETAEGYRRALEDWKERHGEALADIKPRADIQMALTVIGRRSPAQKALERSNIPDYATTGLAPPPYPGPDGDLEDWAAAMVRFEQAVVEWRERHRPYTLDLRETDLRGADFEQGDFQKARMTGAHLEGAVLEGAHLEVADLEEAHLEGADLEGAHLKGANLREAHLEGAVLLEAHLEGANLWGAHLEGAVLEGAHLEGANLREAHLEGANLREAHLEGANLFLAHLEGADLESAHLQGANLYWAQLEGAQLLGAQLERTNLEGANLEGANLYWAHLEGAHLGGAQLEGANLGGAQLDAHSDLTAATLRGAAVRSVDFTNLPQIAPHVAHIFGDASVTLPGGVTPGHPDWPSHWSDVILDYELRNGQRIDLFQEAWRAWQATLPPET